MAIAAGAPSSPARGPQAQRPPRFATPRRLILTEMVVRVVKRLVRGRFREQLAKAGSDHHVSIMIQVVLDVYKQLFDASGDFWRQTSEAFAQSA